MPEYGFSLTRTFPYDRTDGPGFVLVVSIVEFEQVKIGWVTSATLSLTISQYLSSVSTV